MFQVLINTLSMLAVESHFSMEPWLLSAVRVVRNQDLDGMPLLEGP